MNTAKLSLLTSVLWLLTSGLAFAQSPGIYTLGTFTGGTNNVALTATNTTTHAIAISEFDNVGVQVTLTPMSTSTGTVLFNFALSLDSTSYETVPSQVLTVTCAGTGAVTKVNNFSVPSGGTLRLASIANTNAMGMTNISVKVRLKAPKTVSR